MVKTIHFSGNNVLPSQRSVLCNYCEESPDALLTIRGNAMQQICTSTRLSFPFLTAVNVAHNDSMLKITLPATWLITLNKT